MAKFQPSALVTAIKGSVGGMVFRQTASGLIVGRKRGNKVPPTSVQSRNRSVIAKLSQWWRDLTDAERQQWTRWAITSGRTGFNAGQSFKTGFHAFIYFNWNRWRGGLNPWPDPRIEGAQPAVTGFDIIIRRSPQVVAVRAHYSPATPILVGILYMARPRPGKYTGKPRWYDRLVALNMVENDFRDFTADYLSVYNAIPPVGYKQAYRIVLINQPELVPVREIKGTVTIT